MYVCNQETAFFCKTFKPSHFMAEETWFQILPLHFNPFGFLKLDQDTNVSGSTTLSSVVTGAHPNFQILPPSCLLTIMERYCTCPPIVSHHHQGAKFTLGSIVMVIIHLLLLLFSPLVWLCSPHPQDSNFSLIYLRVWTCIYFHCFLFAFPWELICLLFSHSPCYLF